MAIPTTRFIGGWDVDFSDPAQTAAFLRLHGVGERGFEFFRTVQTALEIIIREDGTAECYDHCRDISGDLFRTFRTRNIRLPITHWDEHAVYHLVKAPGGPHVVGGNEPHGLVLPNLPNMKTAFQYIAALDGNDPPFRWLQVEQLPIVYPCFEYVAGVFLDCSDPLRPRVLNAEEFEGLSNEPGQSWAGPTEFEETRFEATPGLDARRFLQAGDIIQCGVPLWYDSPQYPVCPLDGKPMQFVCTINSDCSIPVVSGSGDPADPYLAFHGGGHLFVFFSPDSRVMYLTVQ